LPLREFTDSDGVKWQVWSVDPSLGDHMGVRVDLRAGWLCFERVGGGDRCRLALADAPPAWEQLPADALDRLRRATAEKPSSRAMTWDSVARRHRVEEAAARRRTSGPKRTHDDNEES
jgi:hypothetical protein